MTRPGRETRRQMSTRAERRKNALLLGVSLVIHVLVLFLLPGLTRSADVKPELIVELLTRALPQVVAEAADGDGISPVGGSGDSVSDMPAAAGPARNQPAEGARGQSQNATQAAAKGGGTPPEPAATKPAAPNDSTAVQPPSPVVVKPTEQPKETAPAPVEPPKVAPQEKPANKPNVNVDETPAPKAPEKEQTPAPPAPKTKESGPQPGSGEGTEPGAEGEQSGGQSGGTGDQSGGNDSSGDGSSGDSAGAPGPPPGPSGHELDLLKDYGDEARRRIRMLARTPELAIEQDLSGKVTFEFEVARSGKLVSVKVLKSSSHPVLDEECLEATRVAAPFGRFPKDVTVAKWKFQMTLQFPLY